MMKKALWIMGSVFAAAIIGIGVWVLVGALQQKGPTNENGYPNGINRTDLTAKSEVEISIHDLSFSPTNIIVKKGTTVTWVNRESVAHSVVAFDDTNAGDLPTRSRETRMGKGDTYKITFNQIGTFEYQCGVHSFMRGSVQVVAE
jgi:plastocyanin